MAARPIKLGDQRRAEKVGEKLRLLLILLGFENVAGQ
jgi:hypothetical protein